MKSIFTVSLLVQTIKWWELHVKRKWSARIRCLDITFRQILPTSSIRNVWRPVKRICIFISRLKGLILIEIITLRSKWQDIITPIRTQYSAVLGMFLEEISNSKTNMNNLSANVFLLKLQVELANTAAFYAPGLEERRLHMSHISWVQKWKRELRADCKVFVYDEILPS